MEDIKLSQKEEILKRLLENKHITVDELFILSKVKIVSPSKTPGSEIKIDPYQIPNTYIPLTQPYNPQPYITQPYYQTIGTKVFGVTNSYDTNLGTYTFTNTKTEYDPLTGTELTGFTISTSDLKQNLVLNND